MFQFSGFPPYHYGFMIRYMESVHVGFPIRRYEGQWICAPNRSFSQLVTSFFGSQCQGIHPALFLLNRSDFPLACGRQAFSWFSFLLHVCIFRCFTMSSYPTLRISTKRFYRYSVFMVHRAFPLYKPSEICTLTHRCEALYKKEEMPGSHLLSHGLAP